MMCKAETTNGQPCQTRTIKKSRFCFIHDPANGAAGARVHKRGVERRRRKKHNRDRELFLERANKQQFNIIRMESR